MVNYDPFLWNLGVTCRDLHTLLHYQNDSFFHTMFHLMPGSYRDWHLTTKNGSYKNKLHKSDMDEGLKYRTLFKSIKYRKIMAYSADLAQFDDAA